MVPTAVWDRVARVYDAQLWLERPALDTAIGLAGVTAADRLLDVGSGTGAILRALPASPVPSLVVGVDASTQMLRIARRHVSAQLIHADAQALPLADGGFTVVTCAYMLHLLSADARGAVLAELRRVLTAEGRLVAVTPAAGAGRRGRMAARMVDQLRLGGLGAALEPYDPRDDLLRAGFSVCEHVFVDAGYASHCVLARRIPGPSAGGGSPASA